MSSVKQQRAGPVLTPGWVGRSFPVEFKADAVALLLDTGGSIASVACALGIGATNLGNCMRQARVDLGEREGRTKTDRAERARQRCENLLLRMERDLLEGATTFWVRESGR